MIFQKEKDVIKFRQIIQQEKNDILTSQTKTKLVSP